MPKDYADTNTPLDEWDWVKCYVKTRIDWLSTHPQLSHTVDRLGSIQPLIDANNWKLDLPIVLVTKGFTVTEYNIG